MGNNKGHSKSGVLQVCSRGISIIPERVLTDGVEEIKDSSEEIGRAKIRKRAGLDYERLCKTVADGLVAETVLYTKDGKIVERIAANSERAKFLQAAVDLLGAKKAEAPAQKCPQLIFNLPPGFKFND